MENSTTPDEVLKEVRENLSKWENLKAGQGLGHYHKEKIKGLLDQFGSYLNSHEQSLMSRLYSLANDKPEN